ncbi:uncharacterized protein LOC127836513 isoform X1 [Dreissena polymorpha]|uniref:uncharacterized protein LOC127836513 isoform X1 n=1 Tax=Dreissena polymorpha TaxID=45954 RepID=UPI002264619C|nr:uncharacterized protein LOC127836513 isoform X1 [Dreissena polymorpha]
MWWSTSTTERPNPCSAAPLVSNPFSGISWTRARPRNLNTLTPRAQKNPTQKRMTRWVFLLYLKVLRIYHAMDFQNTKFRCDLVVNGSVVFSHTVRLYVSHCYTRARGPILIEPFPQNQTITDYGGKIHFYCTGDFGCYQQGDVQFVMWSVDTFGNTASDVSDRYHLVTNERYAARTKQHWE